MTDRFDNLSTAELAAIEASTRAELKELVDALERRILAEAPVRVGRTYRIGPPPPGKRLDPSFTKYEGRTIWVRYLRVQRGATGLYPGAWYLAVSGPLKRPGRARTGMAAGSYTSVHPDVLASRLELSTEAEAPPDPYDRPRRDPAG